MDGVRYKVVYYINSRNTVGICYVASIETINHLYPDLKIRLATKSEILKAKLTQNEIKNYTGREPEMS